MTRLRSLATRKGFTQVDSSELTRIFETLSVISNDPEYAGNWEIGYKSQLLDNRMRFNVTYFRNDFEDKQESFVALDPDTKTVASVFDNAASVLYQGIEVEVQYVFNEYFRGFLNYGRLDAGL